MSPPSHRRERSEIDVPEFPERKLWGRNRQAQNAANYKIFAESNEKQMDRLVQVAREMSTPAPIPSPSHDDVNTSFYRNLELESRILTADQQRTLRKRMWEFQSKEIDTMTGNSACNVTYNYHYLQIKLEMPGRKMRIN